MENGQFLSGKNRLGETMDTAIEAAFRQMEEKQYETEMKSLGIEKAQKIAVAFLGKDVAVRDMW